MRMMHAGPVLLGAMLTVAAAIAGFLAPAAADLVTDCNQTANLERQIRACSVIIEDDSTSQMNLAIAHMNRAAAYSMQRRYRQALKDFDRAISIDPNEPLGYYNRANLHFDLGNIPDAIADYSHAIELYPEFALAHFNRGLAREKTGDVKGAAEDYRATLALDPAFSKAALRLKRLGAAQ